TRTAAAASSDPMLVNAISNRALRGDVLNGFLARGYQMSDAPDFLVAYYASAKEKLQINDWGYGYGVYPRWWGWGAGVAPQETVDQYTEGTVIVDVIDPRTKELLWRGVGKADVSDDETKYEHE